MSASTGIIEHVVLFNVKEGTDPSKVDIWLSGLNSLAAIDHVLHLTAGPLLRTQSSVFTFTHVLHCRYRSKTALDAYSAHPDHVRVVKDLGLPICQDLMAVDWVAEGVNSAVVPAPGSSLKVSFLKLKEDVGADVVLPLVKGIADGFGRPPKQFTCGENFSPARARGYSIGWMAVFGVGDEIALIETTAKSDVTELMEYLEDVVTVDYVIPTRLSASI